MIIDPRVFPTVLIVLDVAAAAVYAAGGLDDWRKVVYWLSAATITYAVTW